MAKEEIAMYAVSERDNSFDLAKILVDGISLRVVKRHIVSVGACNCAGFYHRMSCRHVDMVSGKRSAVSRGVARRIVSEIADRWSSFIGRMWIMQFDSPGVDESRVIHAIVGASGPALIVDGVRQNRLVGVHGNLSFEIRFNAR